MQEFFIKKLLQLKDFVQDTYLLPKRLKLNTQELGKELSPVFVIGANRSGTSIITSVFSQHPDLEGIFGHTNLQYDESGHSVGFCESMHIWPHLMPDPEERRPFGQLPYWALPGYLGLNYRNKIKSNREKNSLIWRMQRFRQTGKSPLLKDQFNTLRIGMIKDVFPRARFLLCWRSLEDFSARGIHKWANDNSGTSFDLPFASFHWHMVNIIARYDLEIYFPGQYAVISLDELHIDQYRAEIAFANAAACLSLKEYSFDLETLSINWKKDSSKNAERLSIQEQDLADIAHLVRKEREIISAMQKKG